MTKYRLYQLAYDALLKRYAEELKRSPGEIYNRRMAKLNKEIEEVNTELIRIEQHEVLYGVYKEA